MSLLHRDRRITYSAKPSNGPPGGSLRWRSAVAGVGAAVVSMAIIAMPALLVWVASAESTVDWTRALSVGSSLWLLASSFTRDSPSALSLPARRLSISAAVRNAVPAPTNPQRIGTQLDEPANDFMSITNLYLTSERSIRS